MNLLADRVPSKVTFPYGPGLTLHLEPTIVVGPDGTISRRWHDDTYGVFMMLFVGVGQQPSRTLAITSRYGPIPLFVGEDLMEEFMPDGGVVVMPFECYPGWPMGLVLHTSGEFKSALGVVAAYSN